MVNIERLKKDKSVIIQISVEKEFIEKLKEMTGQKTASKAFMHAANSYNPDQEFKASFRPTSDHLDDIAAKGNELISSDDYEGF